MATSSGSTSGLAASDSPRREGGSQQGPKASRRAPRRAGNGGIASELGLHAAAGGEACAEGLGLRPALGVDSSWVYVRTPSTAGTFEVSVGHLPPRTGFGELSTWAADPCGETLVTAPARGGEGTLRVRDRPQYALAGGGSTPVNLFVKVAGQDRFDWVDRRGSCSRSRRVTLLKTRSAPSQRLRLLSRRGADNVGSV